MKRAFQIMIIGKRHNTRQYRLLNSYFGAFVDKPEIGVRIIEILGYRAVGASFKLFPKPINWGNICYIFKLRLHRFIAKPTHYASTG